MTVQNLYTQYLDGKITKQKFLYEVRRDQHLDMISSSNSFDDVVKILKNKSIISEKAHKEAKLATGKQEVDIIAKTIDMVNPYEYSRGMEFELNIMDVPANDGDLSEDNILKAQKKVLANLTKNPSFYFDKINGKGEVSDEWVEVTKKEIDKIGKGKKNMMREGVRPGYHEDGTPKYDNRNLDVLRLKEGDRLLVDMGDGTQEEVTVARSFIMSPPKGKRQPVFTSKEYGEDMWFNSDMVIDKIGKGKAAKDITREGARPGYHEDGTPKSNDEMSDDELEDFYNDSNFLDEGGNLGHNELSSIHQEGAYWIVTYRGPEGTTEKSFASEEEARKFQDGLNEHGQYADRVADVNADSSPLKEKQEAIYKKYAESTGIPVENLMAMVREAKEKKMEEAATYAGKDAVDDLKRDPKYGTLSSTAKKDTENKLKKGETVTIG